MSNKPLSDDLKVVNEGRKKPFKDVDASPRDQVVAKLRNKLVDMNLGERLSEVWNLGNADRAAFLERQRAFLIEFDEFIADLYPSGTDWGSSLHLPTSLTVAKTYHARMQSALIGIQPPFTVKAQKGANADRSVLVQDLMSYALSEWANKYQGIDEFVDTWLWAWVTEGTGLAKVDWLTEYTRFIDVKKVQKESGVTQLGTDPNTGQRTVSPVMIEVEEEVEEIRRCHYCPTIKKINIEDLLIVGGQGNPQNADYVMEQAYMDASHLWQLVDRKVFNREAVEEVIKCGPDKRSAGTGNQIKTERMQGAGEASLDKTYQPDEYQILECHLKIDVDGSGINSDIICWFHPQSRALLGATYLYRRMPTGRRPYYKIDFYKRTGATYGAGVIELLYSLSKEIDAINNIMIDVGILSSQPFGFYRPTASMESEKLPIEPGSMIPLDNPQSDVFFPNLGNRVSFGFQEIAALNEIISRFMSVSDITFGSTGSQGAARTATGVRSLAQETNANLDVFIRRMNTGWKGILVHLFQLIQLKIEPGFQFRILGDDGHDYWAQVGSPEEIAGMFDFLLEPNSANSNKQVQMDVANQVYQLTSNPLDMQLGLITPSERYEAIKNVMQTMGIKNFSRFVRKPAQGRLYTPEEVANATLAGVDIPLDPTQDLQGIIAYIESVFQHDEVLGQFSEQQAVQLEIKRREAAALLEQMQAMAAQSNNQMQQNANAQQANSMSEPTAPVAQGAPAPMQE